jgi:hypothetical protein
VILPRIFWSAFVLQIRSDPPRPLVYPDSNR